MEKKQTVPPNSKNWTSWIVRVERYVHDSGLDLKAGSVVVVKAPDKETASNEATKAGYIVTGVVTDPRQHEQSR